MVLGSGQFNKRVTIQSLKTTGQDAYNQLDVTDSNNWQTYATRWMELIPKGGREFRLAQQQEADLTHLVRFISDSTTRGITPQMRILYDSRLLNVVDSYDVDGNQQVQECKCVEVV